MRTRTTRRVTTALALAALPSCVAASSPTDARRGPALCHVTGPQRVIPLGDGSMEPICDGVYSEPGATPAQTTALRTAYVEARSNILAAFGELRGEAPLTLFCRTAECKVAFGAPPASAAANDLGFARDSVRARDGFVVRPVVVATGPVSRTANILTHEFVHAEMKAWVPYDALPTWFNEGMATWVAGEPDCRGHVATTAFDVTQLATTGAWEEHLRQTHATRATYCEAHRVVSAWASQFADTRATSAALRRLLRAVAAGGVFDLIHAH